MKIFTIFKCLIRFLNLLFTILKFFRQCYVGDVAKISADRSGHAQQQGIIRCRAGVGGQGSHEAMESPKALMCPLEKGGWGD